jgi:hypothetical protein
MKKKLEILAIHDKNLIKILTDLKVINKIKNEQINCVNCGEKITLSNISGLKINKPNILIYCDNPECLLNETLEDKIIEK